MRHTEVTDVDKLVPVSLSDAGGERVIPWPKSSSPSRSKVFRSVRSVFSNGQHFPLSQCDEIGHSSDLLQVGGTVSDISPFAHLATLGSLQQMLSTHSLPSGQGLSMEQSVTRSSTWHFPLEEVSDPPSTMPFGLLLLLLLLLVFSDEFSSRNTLAEG